MLPKIIIINPVAAQPARFTEVLFFDHMLFLFLKVEVSFSESRASESKQDIARR
jgi:hypothetical protein